jgi:hypothetical protein
VLGVWTDPLVQHKQWKKDMRFGIWNVWSLYWSGKELGKYKLDLMSVQDVTWDNGGIVRAEGYIFSKKNHQLGKEFLYNIE